MGTVLGGICDARQLTKVPQFRRTWKLTQVGSGAHVYRGSYSQLPAVLTDGFFLIVSGFLPGVKLERLDSLARG